MTYWNSLENLKTDLMAQKRPSLVAVRLLITNAWLMIWY